MVNLETANLMRSYGKPYSEGNVLADKWPQPSTEEISLYIAQNVIPKEQLERVFSQEYTTAEICPSFLGFLNTYYHLSQIIPLYYTIYDFGCAYNAQSFLFKNHKKYIAVNPTDETFPQEAVFQPSNCEFYAMTTGEFLKKYPPTDKHTFAICNYVPDWFDESSRELVKKYFQNCYTFYP